MSTLLSYYPSEGLTQAEKTLGRWQQHLAGAKEALKAAQVNVVNIYPATPHTAHLVIGQRRNYLRPLEGKVAQYTDLVADAKNVIAGERAAAYLAHTAAAEASAPKESWLVRAVCTVVLALIAAVPSRVSQPALA